MMINRYYLNKEDTMKKKKISLWSYYCFVVGAAAVLLVVIWQPANMGFLYCLLFERYYWCLLSSTLQLCSNACPEIIGLILGALLCPFAKEFKVRGGHRWQDSYCSSSWWEPSCSSAAHSEWFSESLVETGTQSSVWLVSSGIPVESYILRASRSQSVPQGTTEGIAMPATQ